LSPDVFDYSDFRAYLAAWFDARSERDPEFSHRALAREMNTKDPAVLLAYTKYDKTLGSKRMERFIEIIGLDAEEADYFRLLVAFGHARTPRTRADAWDALCALRASLAKPSIDAGLFEFMSRWLYVALHTMVSLPGFRYDPVWIASQLRPRPTPADVRHAIETLLRLGLVREEGDTLIANDANLHTGPTVRRVASFTFHQQVHELAGVALVAGRDRPVDERDTCFLAASLALPRDRLPQLRKAMWEFLMKASEDATGWAAQADQVFVVELAAFPLTERITRG
jgi:uncharacterized protein (TIGR02147 family)